MRKLLIAAAFCLSIVICTGQSYQTPSEKLKVIPASPTVSAINRYGDYKVNLYNGLPNINIPIYEIKSGEITVPISLSYHPAGIKVNDWGTSVGTGWSLIAGGNISRKINGKQDEAADGYFGNYVRFASGINPVSSQNDYNWLQLNIDQWKQDIEPDIFSYTLPDKAGGKFIFNCKNGLEPILFPKEPYKIDFYLEGGQRFFKLVTDDGMIYNFRDVEWTTSNMQSGSLYSSAWQLTTIISPSYSDTVSFIYTNRYGLTQKDIVDNVSVTDNVVNLSSNPALRIYSEQLPIQTTYNHNIENQEKILSEIIFSNGKVVFEQSPDDRLDGFFGQKKLSAIKVYAKNQTGWELIKDTRLIHGYFMQGTDPDTRRLRLDEIHTKEKGNTNELKHSFIYNEQINLPNRLSRSRDYWGYFNDAPNNSLVPRMEVPFIIGTAPYAPPYNVTVGSSFHNGREVQPFSSQAGMLKKIVYPTGGYTEFEFENNKYLQNGVEKLAGGHRIKKISSYTTSGASPLVKTYKYGENESSYGRANFILNNYYFSSTRYHSYYLSSTCYNDFLLDQKKRVRDYFSNSSLNLEPFDGAPVTYRIVTEYDGDETGINGKTVYTYSDIADEIIPTIIEGRSLVSSKHLLRGQLLEKEVYKKDGSIFSRKEKVENKYHAFSEQSYLDLALVVAKNVIYDVRCDNLSSIIYNYYPDINNGFFDDKYSFGFENYPINTIDQKLTETIVTKYEGGNETKTTNKIVYASPVFLQPTSTEFTNSRNQIINTQTKYPQDFIGSSPYTDMVNRNMVSPAIESKTTNTSTSNILNWQKNNYGYVNGSIIDIASQQKYNTQTTGWDTEASYNSYDSKGNILQVTPKNAPVTCYIWGYNQTYPVAKITGATYADVLATLGQSDPNLPFLQNMSEAGLRSTLNALRTNIKNSKPLAQVHTYLYSPLIGIKEETNASNKTSYYLYDAFNRLSLVKDQDGNIIKRICYNYQGQPEVCYTEPSNQQTIYVRISYENTWWASDYSSRYGDIVVRFYSDAAGTIPLSVSGLTVNYQIQSCFGPINLSATCNGTMQVLHTSALLYDSYYDYYTNDYWSCYYDYVLLTGSYTIIP